MPFQHRPMVGKVQIRHKRSGTCALEPSIRAQRIALQITAAALLTLLASCGGAGSSAPTAPGPTPSATPSPTPSGSVTSQLSINGAQLGQTVTGWEVTPRFWEFDKDNDRYDPAWLSQKAEIARAAVELGGINRVRVELRSGLENPTDYWTPFTQNNIGYNAVRDHFYEKINDNSNPTSTNAAGFQWSAFDYYIENFVLPLKSELAKKGLGLYVNLCFVDFNWTPLKGNLSVSRNANEYAEIMTLGALRLRDKYGIAPDSVEIILEPDNGDGWSGANIGRAALALKQRLAAAGLTPKVTAPSASRATAVLNFLDSLETVPGASGAIDTISYHRYDGGSADGAIDGIRQRASAYGAQTAMLEYVNGDIGNFFTDMTFGGGNAWQAYGVVDAASTEGAAKDGYVLWRNPSGVLALTAQFARIAAIQREVLPGARAIFTARQSGSDKIIAFRNPDGSEVVAVFSPQGSMADIAGLTHGAYQLTIVNNGSTTSTTATLNANGSGHAQVNVPAGALAVLHSI